jgi:hypothetical protein
MATPASSATRAGSPPPHAVTTAGVPVDVDLAAYTLGWSRVSPTYVVAAPQNGAVTLQPDGHTARFQPTAAFTGLASFAFTVTGADRSTYTASVTVLVAP